MDTTVGMLVNLTLLALYSSKYFLMENTIKKEKWYEKLFL